MATKFNEWLVYDDEHDILGFGETPEAARRMAVEDSNMSPGDFGLESWDEMNFEGDGWSVSGWNTARQDQYREAIIPPPEPIRSVLDQLADNAGIWGGAETRRELAVMADEMLPAAPNGADYDRVIEAFRSARAH